MKKEYFWSILEQAAEALPPEKKAELGITNTKDTIHLLEATKDLVIISAPRKNETAADGNPVFDLKIYGSVEAFRSGETPILVKGSWDHKAA